MDVSASLYCIFTNLKRELSEKINNLDESLINELIEKTHIQVLSISSSSNIDTFELFTSLDSSKGCEIKDLIIADD